MISGTMSLLVFVTALAADTPQAGSADRFFAEFSEKRTGIEVLEARFLQQNVSPDETLHSEGSIVYARPRRIVFRYDKPDPGVTYLISERQVYEYQPKNGQLDIYTLEENPQTEIFFLGFENNMDALREGYEVDLFDPGKASDRPANDAAPAIRAVSLRPKPRPDQEPSFREIRLFLRADDYLPVRIHMINDEESEVLIDVSDYRVNQKLDPAKTQISLPEGARIIEDDNLIEKVGPNGKLIPDPAAIPLDPPPTIGSQKGNPAK